MPTVVTHALLPLIGVGALGPPRPPVRLIAAAMIAGMLPDADVVGRLFGVPHYVDIGHRGVTHTVLFALLVGLCGLGLGPSLKVRRPVAAAVLFFSTLSHPLTDMLTKGGKGMMLWWPLERDRFAFAGRPVEVAHVGLQDVYSGRLWPVFLSEALWLLIPALVAAWLIRRSKRGLRRKAD